MILGLHKYINNANPQKGRSGGSGGGGGGATSESRANVALPDGVSVRRLGTNASYDFAQDGNRVSVQISNVAGEHIVDFSVNSRFIAATQLDASTGAQIARKVSSIVKHDASTRPDGFRYSTSAVTGDGLGASRTALYGRAGFSMPSRAGGTQYAVVRNGRMTPSSRDGTPFTKRQIEQQNRQVREALRSAAISRREARRTNP